MARLIILKKVYLSGGGYARVTKLGKLYHFDRIFPQPDQPPYTSEPLTKDEAFARLETCLKKDVCDSDTQEDYGG